VELAAHSREAARRSEVSLLDALGLVLLRSAGVVEATAGGGVGSLEQGPPIPRDGPLANRINKKTND
jgi:hypothetical protein